MEGNDEARLGDSNAGLLAGDQRGPQAVGWNIWPHWMLSLVQLTREYRLQLSGVSVVPEPETYAMLLAGLGLVRVMARRRKMFAEL